jgi:3-deoxy-D-manno-octulosonate 8-phosphate phosphatase (KDO 8-P phosphatase)
MTWSEAVPAGGPIDPERARRVRLVIFDVDGVLTNAEIYVGATASGETVELKRFDIQDGIGLKMLIWAGLEVAIVSGRVSEATAIRARELEIDECFQEPNAHKLAVVEDLLARKGVGWNEVAMLADDIPDLAVLRRVGLKAAVANATPAVRDIADWRSSLSGGHGAAREFCEALLEGRGELHDVIERYVAERS